MNSDMTKNNVTDNTPVVSISDLEAQITSISDNSNENVVNKPLKSILKRRNSDSNKIKVIELIILKVCSVLFILFTMTPIIVSDLYFG